MTARELVDVAVKMLDAHVVVGSDVPAFQHGPMTLDTVRVRLPVHILFRAVLHRLMVGKVAVAGMFVRVDLRSVLDTVLYEPL